MCNVSSDRELHRTLVKGRMREMGEGAVERGERDEEGGKLGGGSEK